MSKSKELLPVNNELTKYEDYSSKTENYKSNRYFRCGQDLGRVSTYTKNVYREKTPPPVIRQIYERAKTPEADYVEKVYIKREPQIIYETLYEKQKPKSPVVIEKFETEPAPAAIHRCR